MNNPDVCEFTVMLAGHEGLDKRSLAMKMTEISHKVLVRMTSNFMPENSEDVDFLVLMLDMTSLASIKTVESFLTKINMNQFTGRICLLATNDCDVFHHCVGFDAIQNVGDFVDTPVLYANLENKQELQQIAIQIINLAKLPSMGRFAATELIDATR